MKANLTLLVASALVLACGEPLETETPAPPAPTPFERPDQESPTPPLDPVESPKETPSEEPEIPRFDPIEIEEMPAVECAVGQGLPLLAGRVVTERFELAEGVKAQLCLRTSGAERPVCLRPEDTGPDGVFRINVPAENRCVEHAVIRVLKPLSDHVTLYCPLELSTTGEPLRMDAPLILHDTHAAQIVPPEGDPSTPRPVTFDPTMTVVVTPDALYANGDGYPALAGRTIDTRGCNTGPEDLALYAFSPEADVDGDGFPFRWSPPADLEVGETVRLHVLGGLGCTLDGALLPEGEWVEIGSATVGAPEEGLLDVPRLPCLTWLKLTR